MNDDIVYTWKKPKKPISGVVFCFVIFAFPDR